MSISKKIKCVADMQVAKWSINVFKKEVVKENITTDKAIIRVLGFKAFFVKKIPARFFRYDNGILIWHGAEDGFNDFGVNGDRIIETKEFVYTLNGTLKGKSVAV